MSRFLHRHCHSTQQRKIPAEVTLAVFMDHLVVAIQLNLKEWSDFTISSLGRIKVHYHFCGLFSSSRSSSARSPRSRGREAERRLLAGTSSRLLSRRLLRLRRSLANPEYKQYWLAACTLQQPGPRTSAQQLDLSALVGLPPPAPHHHHPRRLIPPGISYE